MKQNQMWLLIHTPYNQNLTPLLRDFILFNDTVSILKII